MGGAASTAKTKEDGGEKDGISREVGGQQPTMDGGEERQGGDGGEAQRPGRHLGHNSIEVSSIRRDMASTVESGWGDERLMDEIVKEHDGIWGVPAGQDAIRREPAQAGGGSPSMRADAVPSRPEATWSMDSLSMHAEPQKRFIQLAGKIQSQTLPGSLGLELAGIGIEGPDWSANDGGGGFSDSFMDGSRLAGDSGSDSDSDSSETDSITSEDLYAACNLQNPVVLQVSPCHPALCFAALQCPPSPSPAQQSRRQASEALSADQGE